MRTTGRCITLSTLPFAGSGEARGEAKTIPQYPIPNVLNFSKVKYFDFSPCHSGKLTCKSVRRRCSSFQVSLIFPDPGAHGAVAYTICFLFQSNFTFILTGQISSALQQPCMVAENNKVPDLFLGTNATLFFQHNVTFPAEAPLVIMLTRLACSTALFLTNSSRRTSVLTQEEGKWKRKERRGSPNIPSSLEATHFKRVLWAGNY